VLEPDALASIGPDCLTAARQKERLGLLRYAVQRLARLPGTAVYIDAGHAAWRREEEIADLLRRARVWRFGLARPGLPPVVRVPVAISFVRIGNQT
jgi:endoglucanase